MLDWLAQKAAVESVRRQQECEPGDLVLIKHVESLAGDSPLGADAGVV